MEYKIIDLVFPILVHFLALQLTGILGIGDAAFQTMLAAVITMPLFFWFYRKDQNLWRKEKRKITWIQWIIVIAVAVVLLRRIVRHPLGVAAGFLILSGGVGNIIDRVRLGYVVDMFHLEFWPSYPVFNVADLCVVCGAVLAVIYYLWFYEKYDKRGKAHGDADAPSDS